MRTLLIDGDLLNFSAGAASEYDTQWDTWLWTRHANLDDAIRMLDASIADLKTNTESDEIIIALTDDTNWRKSVMPSYKAHRNKDKKPVCYQALRQYLHETHNVFQRPTLEGDDVLGILATSPSIVVGEKVVWSIDKDLLQIPGTHWRDGEMVCVSPAEGEYLHMMQTLTGDVTDGYPGCPGIGPVKAEKILNDSVDDEGSLGSWWPKIVAAYAKAGLSEDIALQNARVARICRSYDYDFKTRSVKLWTPPKTAAAASTKQPPPAPITN